ncbi:GreA/GreB family elongation factor [Algoriphagus aquimarinus]|uniref:Transcription elongation factor GreB n=1 Tax=Algoriphagus aquimarinus TaxID=237018 RepID=A0A1I0ZM34_9BACT|nr:GreA/GreB family elongation factor [Algoriphagus aquimarinus]SFB26754.1 transcription elongation factor GreB [Algoriphagus aquimarinus]|tara:strand:- start:47651 stop:48151 length:501 start_codon:yes stop_codon:yes gene_type:complete
MSRGFVKEEDQEEIPLVPPRADLPTGVTNYITPNGMEELLAEKQALINEKSSIEAATEQEKRIASNYISSKLHLLEDRIATAKVVELDEQPKNEIRFGATVTLKIGNSSKLENYQIVGVDESDISKGKISFISPIAKILIGLKVGEQAVLKLARENRTFEIIAITY